MKLIFHFTFEKSILSNATNQAIKTDEMSKVFFDINNIHEGLELKMKIAF